LEKDKITPAVVADHFPPHKNDWTAFRTGPLRSLCVRCHNNLSFKPRPVREIGVDGWPLDAAHPVYRGQKAR
jgi:hypothetical protein